MGWGEGRRDKSAVDFIDVGNSQLYSVQFLERPSQDLDLWVIDGPLFTCFMSVLLFVQTHIPVNFKLFNFLNLSQNQSVVPTCHSPFPPTINVDLHLNFISQSVVECIHRPRLWREYTFLVIDKILAMSSHPPDGSLGHVMG